MIREPLILVGDDAEVYLHSEEIGTAPLTVPLTGVLTALPLAFIVAYATAYSPMTWGVSFFLTVVLALGVGLPPAFAAFPARCRNKKVLAYAGLGIAGFALYAKYFFFVVASQRRAGNELAWGDVPGLFFSPAQGWRLFQELEEAGAWVPNWLLVGIEASILMVIIPLLVSVVINDEVFCEKCLHWAKNLPSLSLALPAVAEVPAELDVLADLPDVPEDEYPRLALEIKECSCQQTATYQVKLLEYETEGAGYESKTELTPLLLLSEKARKRLRLLASARSLRRQEGRPAVDVITLSTPPD